MRKPPDDTESAAAGDRGALEKDRLGKLIHLHFTTDRADPATVPRVTVEPFGGSRFFATVLHWPDGRDERLQVFNDQYAAARIARKLDAAFAGCRHT